MLADAAPSGDRINVQSAEEDFLKSVTYRELASVVKQCESASSSSSHSIALSATFAVAVNCRRHSGKKKK